MSYRRVLLGRWSRRDRLAVLVVALTVAFLVGAVLVVVAAGGQTAAIAAEYDATETATHYETPAEARDAAPSQAIVLQVAAVTDPDGDRTYAVGVPASVDITVDGRELTGDSTTRGDVSGAETHRLRGHSTVTVDVAPRGPSLVPPEWYLTTPETVDRLGPTGAIVLEPGDRTGAADAPLQGALPFFLAGTEQALGVVWILALGGGLLVAITVYSTTRMTVADRRETIRVIRTTGATPRAVIGLFAVRATLVGGVGVALGYAVGVIATNAAVNVAVGVGLPTSLQVQVTPTVAGVVGPMLLGLLALTAAAGALAVAGAVRRPPASIRSSATPSPDSSTPASGSTIGVPRFLRPRLLESRVIVPMTATLAAFVVFALVFAAAAGAVAPLADTDEATVSEPGAVHPVASRVPTAYGDALRADDIDASAEILLFAVREGDPLPARGVDYERFATLSDAELVEGRAPEARDEAVVGTGATALDGVDVGDRILVGGSTRAGLTRVEVVGRYAAPGTDGAQLLVSLPTARYLAGVDEDSVHVVRAERLPEPSDGDGDALTVTDVSTPAQVVANRTFQVEVTLTNVAATEVSGTVPVSFGDQHETLEVDLAAAARTNDTVAFQAGPPGTRTLTVGDEAYSIRVVPGDALAFENVPAEVPPGEPIVFRVVDVDGEPVAGADVSLDDDASNDTATTDRNGTARVSFDEPGTYQLVASDAERGTDASARTDVTVTDAADRDLLAALSVSPATPDVLARPNATLELANPWSENRTVTVTIEGPGGETTEAVTLAPGEGSAVSRTLERRPAGEYPVTARVDGDVVAERTYEVTGDDRLDSAIATAGRRGSTPVGEAIAVAFGNLGVVVAVLVGLAGLMTVGATTAAFGGAVHARHRTLAIHRAVGGGPAGILRLVLADALRLGAVASLLAVCIGGAVLWAVDAAGLLTVFGVRLLPGVEPRLVGAIAVAALGVALVSATLATLGVLTAAPARLLRGERADDQAGGPLDG